jgi:cytochrome P450
MIYGDVFWLRLGGWKTVILNGFNVVSSATKRSDDAFSGRPAFLTQRVLKELNYGKESLIFSPFNCDFIKHQKLTSSALHLFMKTEYNSIQDMMNVEADRLAQRLTDKCLTANIGVNVADDIQKAVATISYKLFFGQGKSDETERDIGEIIKTTEGIIRKAGINNLVELIPCLQYIFPWKISEYVTNLQRISTIRDRQIASHIQTFDENQVRDVMDAILKLNPNACGTTPGSCSREMLLCTVQDFFGGGFQTSTAIMTWLIKYMAAFPDVQKRVQDEISMCREISFKERSKLPYTEAVIHEVMRISCVLPFSLPHCSVKDTDFGGIHIKKDTVVMLNLHSVSFDKDVWGDPDSFRPERFLNAHGLDRNICNRIPIFGFGRRRCVGEKLARFIIFVMFTNLMQKCTFIHEDKTINFERVFDLVCRPKPFRVIVQTRI